MRYLVVGGGMQGEVIARNLAERKTTESVALADVRSTRGPRLPPKCARVRADALNADDVLRLSRRADAAVLAVPSAIARRALTNLIDAGVPTADISFTPEPPLDLASRARKAGVPVVLDCGLAPGLSHVLSSVAHRELGGLDSLKIYVGGLPLRPPPIFRHAVYFNARDLLDEYIRPARMRMRGGAISPDPLDAPVEFLVDPRVGRLEGFPSDGLRTLLTSFPSTKQMTELTLRHPGHLETMRTIRAVGLLEGDSATDALARTIAARFPGTAHRDQVLMEVWAVRGRRSRQYSLRAAWSDRGSAMARTTGYTGAATAVLLASGRFHETGVHPPERLGEKEKWSDELVSDLRSHGIKVERRAQLRKASRIARGSRG